MTIDEEEDTSRGDILDHYSPREIATTRYMQHHEWMEEILGSAYSISQINPVDLGWGLQGELESVTKGLFEPSIWPRLKPQTVGAAVVNAEKGPEKRDAKELLAEFQPRVDDKIQEMGAEMRKMEEMHAKRLAKIKATAVYRNAEKELRRGLDLDLLLPPFVRASNSADPSAEDAEDVADSPSALVAAPVAASPPVIVRPTEEILREVESAIGRKVIALQPVTHYDLPDEEIVKMGGIVAQGSLSTRSVNNNNIDILMSDSTDVATNSAITAAEEDPAFRLDIPTPTSTHSPLPIVVPPTIIDQYPSNPSTTTITPTVNTTTTPTTNLIHEPVLDDTMMSDFMNVDGPASPMIPSPLPQSLHPSTLPPPPGGVGLFMIPQMDVSNTATSNTTTNPAAMATIPVSGVPGVRAGIQGTTGLNIAGNNGGEN